MPNIMFSLFKKSTKKVEKETLNSDIVDLIYELLNSCILKTTILDPCAKMYIINTFSISFSDLVSTYSDPPQNTTSAINLYAYFKGIEPSSIRQLFLSMIQYISTHQLGIKYKHDISEVLTALLKIEKLNQNS